MMNDIYQLVSYNTRG